MIYLHTSLCWAEFDIANRLKTFLNVTLVQSVQLLAQLDFDLKLTPPVVCVSKSENDALFREEISTSLSACFASCFAIAPTVKLLRPEHMVKLYDTNILKSAQCHQLHLQNKAKDIFYLKKLAVCIIIFLILLE